MALPSEIRSHHTVWVDLPGCRTRALRYVADGDRLVCLGDTALGRNSAEVEATLESIRASRRFVALEAE
jgi:hypothetical protein